MNTPFAHSLDGVSHRVFHVDDLDRMVEAGVLRPDERLELINGEIIEISPKGSRHEWLKIGLNRYFGKACPDGATFAPEPGWHIDTFTYLEPDFLFFPADLRIEDVKPCDALLVIEISDSSYHSDLGAKAALYARLGVREYWVIDAAKRETHVHLMPKPDGYGSVRACSEDIRLDPSLLRELSLVIVDIPR